MENKLLILLNNHLSYLKNIEQRQSMRLDELIQFEEMQLRFGTRRKKSSYYNVIRPGESTMEYLGNQNNGTVVRIQEAHFLAKSLKSIRKDISLIEKFLKKFERTDFLSINVKLPKVYRNQKAADARSRKRIARKWKQEEEDYKATFPVYKPEELKQPTEDGKMVRTKSEALIYNLLLQGGYTFVYELPIKARTRIFYPDFTILSEIDYKSLIIIEHQGMMSDEDYREKAAERIGDYWDNGYLPGRDVYFTYDDIRGGCDTGPIYEILRSKVRPDSVRQYKDAA